MKTHFAAVQNGIIVGTRSSASRSIEGTGKFGPYTHAVLRTQRKTFLANPEHPEPIESADIISWHGSLANAASGLRQAHVGTFYTIDYDYRPTTEHYSMTYLDAVIVEVVITPRPAKLGRVLGPLSPWQPTVVAEGGAQ